MPAEVKLTVTQGALAGEEFVFTERTTRIAGRADDCDPQIVDDDRPIVSRHHCLFDVNPPDVRVRDFGSLNGTYVNGEMIGQREAHQTAEEAGELEFPERDLSDGDEVRLGDTVLRVSVVVPVLCVYCSREIAPEDLDAEIGPGAYMCHSCAVSAPAEPLPLPTQKWLACASCGRDVSEEAGQRRQGDFVCAECQRDPRAIVQRHLELADSGAKELAPIRGYKIVRELGRGGMGAVFLAQHAESADVVALKVMLPQVAVDDHAKSYFLRETENTKALDHPNVIKLREAGSSDGTFYFTVEYCEGGSVDAWMAEAGGTLGAEEAVHIALQALDGLAYAHEAEIPYVRMADGSVGSGRGLVHRDLKPPNLLMSGTIGASEPPVVKIADFGLSKAFDQAGLSGHSSTGAVGGTFMFMPRQQLIEFKYAKPEVDVWAMAACLYNMLTGAFPRDFKRGADPAWIVLESDAVPIRQRDPSIPPRLAEVIDAALVERPEIGFKSAAELKRALESAL